MILVIAAFVSMIDRSVMPPLVPVIAADLGSPVDGIGLSLTVYAISYAALQLGWATLAARFGRVRILLASTVIGGIANLATAFAYDALTYSVTRGLAGAAFSATITTVLIYYGDSLPIRQRAVATANLAAAISLGLAAGTVGAGAIAQWWGWRWVYVAVAVAALLLIAGLVRLEEPAGAARERLLPSLRRLARNRWAIAILVLTVIEGALLIGVFNYLAVALQATGASVLVAGAATAAFGAAVVTVSQLMRLVLGRWSAWMLLLLAGLAIIAAYIAVAVRISLPTVLAAAILLGLAWALGHTTMQTWMTDAVADGRAIGMSFFSISLFVGASLGAGAGNLAAGTHRFELLFALTTVAAVGYAAATTVARSRYVLRE
ncbi:MULTISPECIES: MFS transporter [Mycobacteriaceae]|uniref:MFS transporter n=1 Tax=Mycolicibacterium parafortuitum TaxID=39692 RepID=A0ACC6MJ37_MYCPF|nr:MULTISPECIES: MFS transporter [Mycobacteriaceae]MDZ5086966.1 MFS transporter [Mycolicibacterium parafortuitum]GFM18291.1 major facilitator superfamily protein [Mycobacterium sp. PO1]GFM24577.1 major facilitator superfamily protein [Mycobacterium sp. PO2]